MCVSKARAAQMRTIAEHKTDETVSALVRQLRALPVSERSSRALGVASQLIEFAAFELAGRQPAGDVASLIDCAARMDLASNDVQTTSQFDTLQAPLRRLQ